MEESFVQDPPRPPAESRELEENRMQNPRFETHRGFAANAIRAGICSCLALARADFALAQTGKPATAPVKNPPALGPIKASSSESLKVTADAGADTNGPIPAATHVPRLDHGP